MTRLDPARFAVAALATWRIAHLVAYEDGPFDTVANARARAGSTVLGELMDCFNCLSLWAAAPFAFAVAPRPRDAAATWLALSGAACLVERVTSTEQQGGWNVLWEEPSLGGGLGEADAREPRRAHHDATPSPAHR